MDGIEEIRELAVRALEAAADAVGRGKDPAMEALSRKLADGCEFLPINDLATRVSALRDLADAARRVAGMQADAPEATLMHGVRAEGASHNALVALDACRKCASFGQVRSALAGSYASGEVRAAREKLIEAMDAYGDGTRPGPR